MPAPSRFRPSRQASADGVAGIQAKLFQFEARHPGEIRRQRRTVRGTENGKGDIRGVRRQSTVTDAAARHAADQRDQ
jgi:hypothetical protein